MKKVLYCFVFLILFSSCENVVSKSLIGVWSIDIISYEENDMRNCLLGNIIRFQEDDVSFPIIDKYCSDIVDNNEQVGKWTMNFSKDSDLELHIASKNLVFSGVFDIKFKKDPINKLLLMELRSNKSLIICRKGLYSYDLNIKTINQLVELSSSPR